MVITIKKEATSERLQELKSLLEAKKFKTTEVNTQQANYLVANGKADLDIREIGLHPAVKDVHWVDDVFQMVSRKWKVNPTEINLGDGVVIGEHSFTVMAGPCSIEDEKQIEAISDHLVENNVRIMRGGVFKPRSSPYTFRGLGIEGAKIFSSICRRKGIKIISEVMQVSQIEELYPYVDVFQIGARNTQNFNLLDALGQVDKPVLLKRGISGTIEELLQSAEYIFSGGNEKIMLCERGIRTYETASRNTLDLNAIPILKEKSHLPVIVDPSHGIGIRQHVPPMALAAVMAGADGVIYETHPVPEKAASDGQQTLNFQESKHLINNLQQAYNLRQNSLMY